jgi:hypothetical protein
MLEDSVELPRAPTIREKFHSPAIGTFICGR